MSIEIAILNPVTTDEPIPQLYARQPRVNFALKQAWDFVGIPVDGLSVNAVLAAIRKAATTPALVSLREGGDVTEDQRNTWHEGAIACAELLAVIAETNAEIETCREIYAWAMKDPANLATRLEFADAYHTANPSVSIEHMENRYFAHVRDTRVNDENDNINGDGD